ncbi:MAG: NUDIX domain-containing protein [Actinobacteria bacterium]|nr:NUDIX domain-containing protein [Actinomycetota bacterium]
MGTADAARELVDVLDADGTIIATVTRAEMRRRRLRHRCTFVIVRTSSGGVLIHRRAPDKDLWPDAWDLAVGGVVGAGEEWDHAAERELAEEVGVVGVELERLGDGVYVDDSVDEVARIWTVVWDGPISFDDGEVVEACVVEPDELIVRIGRDRFVPDSLALCLRFVVDHGA